MYAGQIYDNSRQREASSNDVRKYRRLRIYDQEIYDGETLVPTMGKPATSTYTPRKYTLRVAKDLTPKDFFTH